MPSGAGVSAWYKSLPWYAAEKAARKREWAALPSLSDEIQRLRDLLRQHGIDPQDEAA